MKKILFLVTQSEFGGAQRYIFEMATHLDPQKYEVLVAAGQGNGELFDKIKIQNVKCKIFLLKYLKRVPWPICLTIKEIYNLLKREKPDVLFLCSTTAGLLGSLAAKIYKLQTSNFELRTIYRIGGWAFRDPRLFLMNKFILWVEKLTAPLKDKIIVNSEIDRQEAIKSKICPAEKIVKIYNGIDPEKLNFLSQEEARQKLSTSPGLVDITGPGLVIIGCVANLYNTKGLPYLIEAAHILNSKFENRAFIYKGEGEEEDEVLFACQNSKFLIIGDGRQRNELENLIEKYNLKDTVFLLGRIPDAYKYLKTFDIFVLPSLKEGFPWVILEAMVAKIPIVATRVGAIPEIIEDGKEGILVEPKNPQILAEKIFWLLRHQKEVRDLKFRVKEKLKKFTLEKMVEETEKLLTSV